MKELKEETKNIIIIIGSSLLFAMPLIVMLFIYLGDINSPCINKIYGFAKNYPEISLPRNPVLSESMSLYLKTIPIYSLIFIFFYRKRLRKISKFISLEKMVWAFLGMGLFCFGFLYVFLFCNIQLTQTRGFIPQFYTNDYLLTIYFVILFICIYFLTVAYVGFACVFLRYLFAFFLRK